MKRGKVSDRVLIYPHSDLRTLLMHPLLVVQSFSLGFVVQINVPKVQEVWSTIDL